MEKHPSVVIPSERGQRFTINNFCKVYDACMIYNGLHCSVKRYKVRKFISKEKDWLEQQKEYMHHPNLTSYFCLYESGKTEGMVTELIHFSLRTFVASRRTQLERLPLLDMYGAIVLDVISAMRYLHEKGLAHRCLNPYNVFLTSCLTAKVGNFYSVGPTSAQAEEIANYQVDYDKSNQENSLDFLPPNYDKEFGESIDYFAFGCLVLFVFTHQWPTPLRRIGSSDTRALRELERRNAYVTLMKENELHPAFMQVVETCLSDEASKRENFKWVYSQLKDKCNVMQFKEKITDAILQSYWLKPKGGYIDNSPEPADLKTVKRNIRPKIIFYKISCLVKTPFRFTITLVIITIFLKLLSTMMKSY
jgi:serine/threonine protein kinase